MFQIYIELDEGQVVLIHTDGYLKSSEEQATMTPMNGGVITTRDLISWSFQIARGMNYLANKKVS